MNLENTITIVCITLVALGLCVSVPNCTRTMQVSAQVRAQCCETLLGDAKATGCGKCSEVTP